jgi:putative mRNA 3-end processing factor
MADMVVVRKEGLYCVPGDFYIDPWRPVARAVITHGHGDHARPGHGHYLCATPGVGILRARLGEIAVQGLDYGRPLEHRGVRLSLHPAGHVLGSAQVRMEYHGEVWVASGDYKVEADATCAPFEPVRCHCFITESTFGLPIYRWTPQQEVFADINAWWRRNASAGRCSVLLCYAFGKAQRILSGLDPSLGPIVCHGALEPLNRIYRAGGIALPPTVMVGEVDKAALRQALVLRQRLDAAARGAAPARGGSRFRPVRPCRLARPDAGDPGHRCHARHRDARRDCRHGALAVPARL